jgi:hypothetical protein
MNETLHYHPSSHTVVALAVFLVLYELFLIRKAFRKGIDLYDLLILSSVALLPATFAFFPDATQALSTLLGVNYPFVVLFGLLFFMVFFYFNRLVAKVNALSHRERILAQELALLREMHEPQPGPESPR